MVCSWNHTVAAAILIFIKIALVIFAGNDIIFRNQADSGSGYFHLEEGFQRFYAFGILRSPKVLCGSEIISDYAYHQQSLCKTRNYVVLCMPRKVFV